MAKEKMVVRTEANTVVTFERESGEQGTIVVDGKCDVFDVIGDVCKSVGEVVKIVACDVKVKRYTMPLVQFHELATVEEM